MYKCCENCKWRETEHITGDTICVNHDSEWCTDSVNDEWCCDEWKAREEE